MKATDDSAHETHQQQMDAQAIRTLQRTAICFVFWVTMTAILLLITR